MSRPVFPFSENLHPPRAQPDNFLLWLLTCYYFHRETNKHRLRGTAKIANLRESVADAGVQNEDFGDSSCANGHASQSLHAACCRAGHGEEQAESGFAVRASTKALAAAAIESEGCKGSTQPASAADSPSNVLQELFPFTTLVFSTRVGTHTRKRTPVLSNNNTMLYNTQ